MILPLDQTPYPQDPRSRLIDPAIADGSYVYVQEANGTIHVLPDGPHMHPKILGGGQPVKYAGDMTVMGGKVVDLTNLSGTFPCDDEIGLKAVADNLRQLGLTIERRAVRFFPPDGSRPIVLE